MLRPTNIKDEVFEVLLKAKKGKGNRPNFITAYQILKRLPAKTRTALIKYKGGVGGKGFGKYDGAVSQVAKACLILARENKVEVSYLDTKDLSIHVGLKPGYEVCAIYRVKLANRND